VRWPQNQLSNVKPPSERFAALVEMGSLPSFAAQSTNGRNAENRPFAALVANVSVADQAAIRILTLARLMALNVVNLVYIYG